MKKKLLPVLLLVVIVINFIFCSSAYADPDDVSSSTSRYGGNGTIKGSAVEDLIENGTDSNGNTYVVGNFGDSIIGVVLQYVASIVNSFPITIQGILTIFTLEDDGSSDFVDAATNPDSHFTIEKTVFNEIPLFNINVFNTEDTYTNGTSTHNETITQNHANILLKEATATWFYNCRLLAMMINLCILIYVGIRMAISTIASEEAKYKKMLINWAQSMVVLFLLHYIMLIVISLGEIALNILNTIRYNMIANNAAVSFEDTILENIYWAFDKKSGIQLFMYSVFFWFLTYLQLKFFIKYFKRMLTIMFLTIIAPFITITYPIDKMGDNKAQAFEMWLKEYIVNVAMQPIHAAIYLVFVYTAGAIAEQAPFIAMVFLLSLGRIENIVKNVFGLTGTVTMGDIKDEKVKIPFLGR